MTSKDSMEDYETLAASPSSSSPTYKDEEYNALLHEKHLAHQHHHQPRPKFKARRKNLISKLTLAAITLTGTLLFTITLYLLILLRNIPTELSTVLSTHDYKGPLPIHHDPTLGPYLQCAEINPATLTPPTDCSFDLLSNGWVPNPCFNAKIHTYHTANKSFEFYRTDLDEARDPADPSLKAGTVVTQADIMKGNISLYPTGLWVSWREHKEHCWYLLNSTVIANSVRGAARLDTWLDPAHMQHCFGVVQQEHGEDFVERDIRAFFVNRRCFLGRGGSGTVVGS